MMISKIQGNIVDILMPPLRPGELLLALAVEAQAHGVDPESALRGALRTAGYVTRDARGYLDEGRSDIRRYSAKGETMGADLRGVNLREASLIRADLSDVDRAFGRSGGRLCLLERCFRHLSNRLCGAIGLLGFFDLQFRDGPGVRFLQRRH